MELEKFTKLAVDIDNEFDELIFTMKNAHTIDISKPIEVPLFWNKDWLQGVIKELNLSTMSPQNRALYNISIGRLIAINEQNEIDRQEMRQEVREEVKEEVREEVKEEVREEVKEEVKLDIKAEAIQKALKAGKLTIEEVADYNDVTVEFVLKVKEGMDKTIQ